MAALTQSARLPGPSWDEEVVPALRKRLESESRTLAKRMSAASLASSSDGPPTPQHPSFSAAFSDASIPGYTALPSSSSPSNYSHVNPNTPTTPRARHHYHPPPDRSMTSVSSPGDHAANLNGYTSSTSAATPNAASQQTSATSTSSPSPSFQRSRAVSQPYLADLPNGTTRSRGKFTFIPK
ncbi:hypothetical protein AX16_008478 [Volvariella volvacea WC 439]|nr:hypothetical protein AX16_008478 [Volvariella volvacea WC 439]